MTITALSATALSATALSATALSATALSTEAPDAPLRRALRTDGVLSTAAGVAVLAAVGPVSSATGMSTAVAAALGGGTVLCGVAFLALSRAVNVRPAGVSVAAGNAAFTVAAITAAAVASPPLTTTGVLSILGAGAYTAVIGAVQYRGARRMSTQVLS